MKCFFCYVDIHQEPTIHLVGFTITHFTCPICETEYVCREETVLYYRIHGIYKDKKYVGLFDLEQQRFGLGFFKSEVVVKIFHLDFLPKSITPDNFSDKLPTYLIFS